MTVNFFDLPISNHAKAMDDDDSGVSGVGLGSGSDQCETVPEVLVSRKGQYHKPTAGLHYLWIRAGHSYRGLAIRDFGAGRDLLQIEFKREIVAASSTKGRRSGTALPLEDLTLIQQECSSGHFILEVTDGSLLQDVCVASPCQFKDIEHILGGKCDWGDVTKHWVELRHVSTRKPRNNSNEVDAAVVASAGVEQGCATMPVQSPIDSILDSLKCSLVYNESAMQQLDCLAGMLKVTKGTQPRASGGVEYQPNYMLNSVMLSDRLKVPDEMGHAMTEYLDA